MLMLLISKLKEQHEADSVSLQDRVTDIAESTGEFASEQFEKQNLDLAVASQLFKKKLLKGRCC